MNNLEYIKKYSKEEDLNKNIELLNKGLPPQYIIGEVDFYGNIIKVNKDVLIPRFETELLVEKTIKKAKDIFNKSVDIIDIGTGSGCIAITLKKELDCNVTAVDISDKALLIAKENALLNDVEINFIKSDILNNIKDKYDIIISNPPYIMEDEDIEDIVKNNEPHLALYAPNKGLYFYEEILKTCKNNLKDNYLIAFEIGMTQATDIVDIANKYLDNINIYVEKDYSGKDRYIFITSMDNYE